VNVSPLRTVGSLTEPELRAACTGTGLGIRVGPFNAMVRTDVRHLPPLLRRFYGDYPLLDRDRVFHFHVGLARRWRRSPRPARMVRFTVDGRAPHEDMPLAHSMAVLEWGFNLATALRYHRYLMLHSAVLERNGRAIVLPAAPGSGKTTLCAALAHHGWRLFSDEFGLVRPGGSTLVPVPRPMPLKNESIAVIRSFAPDAELGPEIPGTRKGTVCHVRVPADSVRRFAEETPAAWLVFPQWQAGATLSLQRVSRYEGLQRLATNAFNYEIHGDAGFATLKALVEGSQCYRLQYSDLNGAVRALTALADERASDRAESSA
jgi:HprK-related kinase A